jgi:signal transduction histidine kinase
VTVQERALIAEFQAFAALAAHQLGEALALMRGGAGALDEQRERFGGGADEAFSALEAGGERAQRFVDDLLDLVAAGREPPEGPPASLEAAMRAASDELDLPLRRAGTAVVVGALPESVLTARVAQRLFVHLLRSALAAGARAIEVAAVDAGDRATLTLTDDGTPPREQTEPLELFARPRGRGPLVGAGVSLIVARRLVERADGVIEVARSEGTSVAITLPTGR